jgi:transcriptional regulator with XRE-family HTH domain
VTRADLALISATRKALRTGQARRIREAAGVTAKEMAAACGTAPSYISMIERIGPGGAPLRVPGTKLALAYGRALAALGQRAA